MRNVIYLIEGLWVGVRVSVEHNVSSPFTSRPPRLCAQRGEPTAMWLFRRRGGAGLFSYSSHHVFSPTKPILRENKVNYLSVCSGIEAASTAWHELGWNPVAFSEIEKFPCAVIAHHYPTVPNLGDMTKFHEWPNLSIDLLVGGTPCQAFSVAGLRQGLADPRGNLTLTYLAVAAKYRPQWVVWENVPGVLSDRTNAFGQFLAGLAELGYGWAYRMLDAQYFGLAQRRKRVFVVGCLGGWECAAAVLFEPESMRGDNPPSRETRKEITGTLSARTQSGGGLGTDFDLCGGLQASTGGADENDAKDGRLLAIPIQEPGKRTGRSTNDRSVGLGIGANGYSMYTLRAGAVHGVAHTLKAEGFDAGEDGTGRGTPLIPVVSPTITSNYGKQVDSSDTSKGPNVIIDRWPAEVAPTLNAHFGSKQGLEDQHALGGGGSSFPPKILLCLNAGAMGRLDWESETLIPTNQGGFPGSDTIAFSCKDHAADAGEVSPTLRSMGHSKSHANAGGQVAVALALRGRDGGATAELGDEKAFALRASSGGGDKAHAMIDMAVRRLTPKECERLQGFPDNYTNIPWRTWQESERKGTSYESLLLKRGMKLRGPNVEACPDGPRYKALGNSMAVPCMRWIGKRIAAACVGNLVVEDWS